MGGYWGTILQQRTSRRRALAFSATTAATAAFLAACGGGSSSSSSSSSGGSSAGSSTAQNNDKSGLLSPTVDTTKQAKRGGTHKFYIAGEPSSFDVHLAINPLEAVQRNVYARLTSEKPGYLKPTQNNIAPDIAESWETSPDGLTITLKVRQGVKWHNKAPVNGRAMDMDDILFSWNRFATKGSPAPSTCRAARPVASLSATLVLRRRSEVLR